MKRKWQSLGGGLYLGDTSTQLDTINSGIYDVQYDEQRRALFLMPVAEKFTFDYKIYGLETKFISRVLKTYNNTKGNLGVLMNGIKGTGKTVTSEILANSFNLPVLLVSTAFPGLNSFLHQIQQDVVVLIDEYDKVYKGNIDEDDYDGEEGSTKGDSSLLGLMDGTLKTPHRKVFLLTTNRTWLNDNMLNRPGRIRYLKHFGDLNLEQINEIVDDCLLDKKYREDIIAYLKPLKIITVDIVKAIISQINIFDEAPTESCKDLNIQMKEDEWNIVKVVGQKEEMLDDNPNSGYINQLLVSQNPKNRYLPIGEDGYHVINKVKGADKTYVVSEDGTSNTSKMTIRIKKHKPVHSSFVF